MTQSEFNIELIKSGEFICRNSQFCLATHVGKHNRMFGAEQMKELDIVAAVFAAEICDTPYMVTKTMNVEFIAPIIQNQIFKSYVKLLKIGRTSIELEVEIRTHSVDTDAEIVAVKCNTVFVRINEWGEKLLISDNVRLKFGYELINNYKKI